MTFASIETTPELRFSSLREVKTRISPLFAQERVAASAMETSTDDDAVLVIDETGFLKQSKQSCGAGRQ